MRLRWICLLLSLLGCLSVQAQQTPVGSLPAQYHALGWIRIFDGLSLAGWQTGGKGSWTIDQGALVSPADGRTSLQTTTLFGDFEFEFEYRLAKASDASILVRNPSGNPSEQHAFVLKLTNSKPGTIYWRRVHILAQGEHIAVFSQESENAIVNNSRSPWGTICLLPGKGQAWFRDLRLRPIRTHSLFDGKSLAGWKPLPNQTAHFEVTPDGLLHASGGSGELRTDAQWDSFILQCEVKTNTPHAQGGVLVRAIPDQPGNGYEDHIRNQWQGIDHTMPVDYGTGGIYLHKAVREVVSNDSEWTSLTFAVEGSHFTSWVNGYLVADYRDTRPPDRSDARKGARTAAGSIGLVLHNDASDISFRNIRIEPMAPPSSTTPP